VCRPACRCVLPVQTLQYEYPCSISQWGLAAQAQTRAGLPSRKLHSRNINYHTKEMLKEICIGDSSPPPPPGRLCRVVIADVPKEAFFKALREHADVT
jgi:hypothetical protein